MMDIKKHLKVDKELIIIFLSVAIAGMVYFVVASQRAFLNFFYLPVLLGAYFFGKRHGTFSAVLSMVNFVSKVKTSDSSQISISAFDKVK